MPFETDTVECPVCGESFDPSLAGGVCTNPECGEYTHEPEDAGDEDEIKSSAEEPPESPAEEQPEDKVECPNCGDEVPDKQFCLHCGESLTEAESDGDATEPVSPTCSNCGNEVQEDWAACPQCGTSLEADTEADTEGAETAASRSESRSATDAESESESDSEPEPEPDSEPEPESEPEPASTVEAEGGADADATASADSAPTAEQTESEDEVQRVILEVGDNDITAEDGDFVGRKVRSAYVRTGAAEEEAQYIHREHVLFEREGETFYLVNKGRNGTKLNGTELELDERRPIDDGDTVEFSDRATAEVRIE